MSSSIVESNTAILTRFSPPSPLREATQAAAQKSSEIQAGTDQIQRRVAEHAIQNRTRVIGGLGSHLDLYA